MRPRQSESIDVAPRCFLGTTAHEMESERPPQGKSCLRCGICCKTHPCALAPDDLIKLARFLGTSSAEIFKRYLVLDYVFVSGEKRYYACPARASDQPGTIVASAWTFSDSPCVFLRDNICTVEQAKPRGGKSYSCVLMTPKKSAAFGKMRAEKAWRGSQLLKELLCLVDPSALS